MLFSGDDVFVAGQFVNAAELSDTVHQAEKLLSEIRELKESVRRSSQASLLKRETHDVPAGNSFSSQRSSYCCSWNILTSITRLLFDVTGASEAVQAGTQGDAGNSTFDSQQAVSDHTADVNTQDVVTQEVVDMHEDVVSTEDVFTSHEIVETHEDVITTPDILDTHDDMGGAYDAVSGANDGVGAHQDVGGANEDVDAAHEDDMGGANDGVVGAHEDADGAHEDVGDAPDVLQQGDSDTLSFTTKDIRQREPKLIQYIKVRYV